MHYLTNYYKNLCEQLQEKVNYLEKFLKEANQPNEEELRQFMSDFSKHKWTVLNRMKPVQGAEDPENMKRQAFGAAFSKESENLRGLHDHYKRLALDLVQRHPHLDSVENSIAHVNTALDKQFPIENAGQLISILMDTGHLGAMREKLGDKNFGRHVADMLISAETLDGREDLASSTIRTNMPKNTLGRSFIDQNLDRKRPDNYTGDENTRGYDAQF